MLGTFHDRDFSNVPIQSIDAKSENLSLLSKIISTRFLSK